ncbi:hypothetical protein ABPG77_005588 [Micractinium sp. CCAP 211/92]
MQTSMIRAGISSVRRTFSHFAGSGAGSSSSNSSSSGPLSGLLRQLRQQRDRPAFRTFSSGGGGGTGGGSSGGGGGGGGSGGGGLWVAYLALLEKQPLLTKALTAALLNGLGDAIAQSQFEKGGFNWKRFAIFTGLGLVVIGPALHFWYGSLGSIVKATGNTGAIMRLSLDQLCFAPVFISMIVSLIMVLEGAPVESVAPRLRRDLPDMVRSNWLLWVPFQFVNFRFVPPQLQVLASNACALLWNTYISWKSHA